MELQIVSKTENEIIKEEKMTRKQRGIHDFHVRRPYSSPPYYSAAQLSGRLFTSCNILGIAAE
eukprot:9474708-Pyramimonas_sp.AAC.2